MRELTRSEIEEVSGGVGPAGAAIGALTTGIGTAMGGGNAGQVVGSAIVGGVAGFFGGIATSQYSSRLTSYMFGAYAIETGVIAGSIGS